MTTEQGLSTTQVSDLTGATYRQIDYWCRRGLIPGQEQATGSGRSRTWTGEQVREVELLLRASKLINARLEEALEALRDE